MNDLKDVSGIGIKTLDILANNGINSIDDLLHFYPRKYRIVKRSDMNSIQNLDKVIIDGVVEAKPTIINIANGKKKII